jgi:hypothetical protein
MVTTGQGVAIKGETVGYYLFRRCEATRVWDRAQQAAGTLRRPSLLSSFPI